MNALDRAGITGYEATGYCLGSCRANRRESAYLTIPLHDEWGEEVTIRVGDHAAPNGSGFSEERQTRHLAPDYDVRPDGMAWREAVGEVLKGALK